MSKPMAIDLFCGAGGLSEGLSQAGYSVLGAVEIDPLACETYKLNHSRARLWQDDIRKVSGKSMMKKLGIERGELALLAACPPCQGFSSMRTKNGKSGNKDPRNNLIFEVLRLVRSLRPLSVMIENVPGLSGNWRWKKFLRGLKKLSYHITWDVLNVVDYAVPQSRRRLVLLASRIGKPEFAPKARINRTVRDAIGSIRKKHDPLHCYKPNISEKVKELIAKIPKNGGSRISLGSDAQLECHKNTEGFHDVYGRMSWSFPAPTITGGCINPSKGRFLHPSYNRAITLREAASIQTFPTSYKFSLKRGRYAVALLIGNALPPEFIRRQALALERLRINNSNNKTDNNKKTRI